MKTHKTYCMITGAGKGLGKAFARELASRGYHLLLAALPNEGLDHQANQLREHYHIDVEFIEINLAQEGAISQLAQWAQTYHVGILINNAGIGSAKFFNESSPEHLDAIIQVNVRTLALLTRLLLPQLQQHAPGYVLNVSSMSGYTPVAYKTVYPASKSFVYSFSRSLCEELKSSGIHVSVVLPGPIKTNAEVSQRIEQHGWWVRESLLSPAEIAAMAIDQTFKKRKVIIPGKINKINWLLSKLLPRGLQIPLLSNVIKQEILNVAASDCKAMSVVGASEEI